VADRAAKDELYDGFAEVAKALSSGRRAEIVDVLAQGERSVDEIATEIDQSVANTSHHLRALARAGLVLTRREGTRIYYGLSSARVGELWSALRDVAGEHVAGLQRLAAVYLGDREGIEEVDRDELARRLKAGELVVLDVRPPAEYAAGHIAGPYCTYADEAVRELVRKGFRARRLTDGFPEWQRAGLPVAVGAGS
jgi:DNA-binding transcriptional ArsR family regulator